MSTVTQALLHELLLYDEGKLYWKVRSSYCVQAGDRAGSRGARRYRNIQLLGKTYLEHRLIWIMHNGDIPDGRQIDHINRNTSDNSISNLRLVDVRGNASNRHNNNTNVGVHKDKRSGKWVAQIYANGKKYFGGGFNLIEDAILSRKNLEKAHTVNPKEDV